MKTLAKLALMVICAVLIGEFISEWAQQLAETREETIQRHEALLADQ